MTRNPLTIGVAVLTASLLVSIHGQAQDAAKAAPKGDVKKGQEAFAKYGCYQCHGREAQGGSTGPRLGPDALPYGGFTAAIRTPREMPPYSVKVLSDAIVADLYAFVLSRPAPPKDIPLLKGTQ
jgi:mono/diheme cytochrome c family protein